MLYCKPYVAQTTLLYSGQMTKRKNPAAIALAKLRAASLTSAERSEISRTGGLLGGKARAAALTPKRRVEIAKKAAATRWANAKKKAKE